MTVYCDAAYCLNAISIISTVRAETQRAVCVERQRPCQRSPQPGDMMTGSGLASGMVAFIVALNSLLVPTPRLQMADGN